MSSTYSPADGCALLVHGIRTFCALIVMPRSRSMSIRSRYCARIDRASTTPVSCSIRSASVDLPWSMWAMMQKFRIRAGAVNVWSAKLLMKISWARSEGRSPGYLREAFGTQSRPRAVPYAREYGTAVEDVPAFSRCHGEPRVQRGAQVHPDHSEFGHAAGCHPAEHQVRHRRHHRGARHRHPRDHRGPAG